MAEITNHRQVSYKLAISHCPWQITWEYHSMPCTFFLYTYMPLRMLCTKNPHNTAPPMLPCGKCANSSVTMQFFSLPSKSTCHVTWKPTIHGQPIFPHPIPFLTFLALAFTMLNLLLLFNLSFPSSTLLLWLSFGYQTGM